MAVTPRLSKAAAALIEGRVDDVFDALKVRLLGWGSIKDRRLFISVGFTRDHSLPGMFESAVAEEGGRPDLEYLDRLIAITTDYIDAQRLAAKARVKKRVQDLLHELDTGKLSKEDLQATIEEEFTGLWQEVTNSVRRVVETETQHAQTLGIKEGIDQVNERLGVEDPVVCFITAKDQDVCEECIRLHTFRDTTGTRIPRVWKSSEVSSGYHKKGDPTPSWSLLHPHCRCALTTVLPGFGFSDKGHLQWKGEGHDEWARQRGLEERYLDRYGKLRKSTPEGLSVFKAALPTYKRHLDEERGFMRGAAVSPYRQKLIDALNAAPIAINFPEFALEGLHRNGRVRNGYETGASNNSTDGFDDSYRESRERAEKRLLDIPESTPAEHRPIYGALHIGHDIWGHTGVARAYGRHWMTLKPHVKERSTFTVGDSFYPFSRAVPHDGMDYIAHSIDNAHDMKDVRDHFSGANPLSNETDSYVEAQIYGGVDLSRDVESLHYRPLGLGSDDAQLGRMLELAKKHKIPVYKHEGPDFRWGAPNVGWKKTLIYNPRDTHPSKTPAAQMDPIDDLDAYKAWEPPAGLIKSTREGHQTFLNLLDSYIKNGETFQNPVNPYPGYSQGRREKARKYWEARAEDALMDRDNDDPDRQKYYAFQSAIRNGSAFDWGASKWTFTPEAQEAQKGLEELLGRMFPEYDGGQWNDEDPLNSRFVDAIANAPITMNFPSRNLRNIMEEGRYKNLFETGDGQGSTDTDERRGFEESVLGIPEHTVAKHRPVYGALNYASAISDEHKHRGGAYYGDAWLELHDHVKDRASFTPEDSFGAQAQHVFTRQHPEALARAYTHASNSSVVAHHHFAYGTRAMSDADFPYIEAQVHGGVYPEHDVKALHITRPESLDDAVAFGKKFRVPVYHHNQMKKRHIHGKDEWEVKLVYHPDADMTVSSEGGEKLAKSTPAGLKILDSLRFRYRQNQEDVEKHLTFSFGKPEEVSQQFHRAPITINFPSDFLHKILFEQKRFMNLGETGNGGGNTNQDVRKQYERLVLGIPAEAGWHERPIYGALHLWHGQDPTMTMEARGGASQYGDAFVTLKPHVHERATLTPMDSFGSQNTEVFPADTGRAALLHYMTIGHMFDPESHRALLRDVGSESSNGTHGHLPSYHYIEAQIHGGVGINDIDAIHLTPNVYEPNIAGAVELGKKHGIPVYHYKYTQWEKPWKTREQEESYKLSLGGKDDLLPTSEERWRLGFKRNLGLSGVKLKKLTLYHPDQEPQAPPVEMTKSELIAIPLFKAANWSLKDFEKQIGEFGWYPHSNSDHKLYAHHLIPFKLAVKHEHAHGNLTPYWVKKYAKDIGLKIGYTGQAMQADPSHAYAHHYRTMGHLPPDPNAPPPMKTWEPASEHHEVVPIESLVPTKGTTEPWKVMRYQAAFAKGAKVHPVSVMKDGDTYLVDRGHHLLQAAKLAGITHVPVRHA